MNGGIPFVSTLTLIDMNRLLAPLCAIFSTFVLGHPALSAAPAPIKVLIIDGYSNHDWQRNTPLIRAILDNAGLFQVTVSTAPPTPDAPGWDAWRPKFADYDVVIQTCNDLPGGSNPQSQGPQWPAEVQKAFEEYVSGGGGLFVYHGGNNAFAGWPAYNEMIGLGWRPANFGRAVALDEKGNLKPYEAGVGEKTGHGKRIDTIIHRRGEHPIHQGFPAKWMAAELEIYFYARGPAKNMEVISYGLDQKTQQYWPTEWTVQYGKGRVYSSTCGHFWKDQIDPPNLSDVAFQTILPRALQWLAKRDVTYPIPANFPGPDQPSLRVLLSIPPAAAGEVQLFNGKDLTGWTVTKGNRDKLPEVTASRFSAKNGVLVVHPAPPGVEKAGQRITTEREFAGDFELRLEFRAEVNADSGLFIRKPQLQVRDYLVAGPYNQLNNYKPQDWNEIVVVVKDNVAHCTCNGEVLEAALALPPSGPIGLEADLGQMEYRNLRLRPLP